MGIAWSALVGSPGIHCASPGPALSMLPAYVVVYVQSYNFVATVWGSGICESAPVLRDQKKKRSGCMDENEKENAARGLPATGGAQRRFA